uniref:Astacin domain-containing protein n=1 Tax=Bursaphelenchus xylophilus TaxID=6326 RepID=A0A1I7SRC3_BURXY
MNAVEVLHVLLACLWCYVDAKKAPKRFHYGYVPEDPKPVVMTSTHVPVTDAGPQLWPLGRIPFIDDPDLIANEDQAVALNNARMDLQIRTCVKFVPRKNERDYVYFTDLGMDVEPVVDTPEPPIPLPPPSKKKVKKSKTAHTPFPPHIELPTPPPLPSTSTSGQPSPLPMELEVFTLTPTPDPTTTTTILTTETTTTTTTTPPITTMETTVTNTSSEATTTETTTTAAPITTQMVPEPEQSNNVGISPMSSYPPTPQPITAEVVENVFEFTTELPTVTDEVSELIPIVQTTHIKAKMTTQTFAQKSQAGIRGKISHKDGLKSYKMKPIPMDIMDDRPIGTCGSPCNYTGGVIPLRRSYNDKLGITDHFYTEDLVEQKNRVLDGYLLQTPMGYIGKSSNDPSCTCLRPLYRLYNEFLKDHLLTSREHEKEVAERILGYKYEKVLGFCTKEPGCGAYLPLYRFYNPIAKDHLYTVDEQEMQYYKKHPEHAYGFEYIECYVWKQQQVGADCPLQNLAINKAELAQLALMGWNNT